MRMVDKLVLIEDEIASLKRKIMIAELAWEKVSINCKYNQVGSDEAPDCTNTHWGRAPFCDPGSCPVAKQTREELTL
jgi:hypothetical protein